METTKVMCFKEIIFQKNDFHEPCPNSREQIALMPKVNSLSSKNFRKIACFFLFFFLWRILQFCKKNAFFLFLTS